MFAAREKILNELFYEVMTHVSGSPNGVPGIDLMSALCEFDETGMQLHTPSIPARIHSRWWNPAW